MSKCLRAMLCITPNWLVPVTAVTLPGMWLACLLVVAHPHAVVLTVKPSQGKCLHNSSNSGTCIVYSDIAVTLMKSQRELSTVTPAGPWLGTGTAWGSPQAYTVPSGLGYNSGSTDLKMHKSYRETHEIEMRSDKYS
jgi:hypothetical protein